MNQLPAALPAALAPADKLKVADYLAPVSANVIAQIFGMIPATAKERLSTCPSTTDGRSNIRKYLIKDAAEYLVAPAFTPAQFIGLMKRGELPNNLSKDFWDAQLKQQKWEENAGDLWRTTKVREALGDTFQTIKFTMQLWVDSLERQTSLSNEQREIIVTMVDALQTEVYDALVKKSAKTSTVSTIGERPS
jgi:hypothetical protein